MENSSEQTGNFVGVEVSRSELNAVCLDSAEKVVNEEKGELNPSEDTAPQLVDFINGLYKKFGDFRQIGITVPGLIDRESKRIAFSAQHPEHAEIDFLGELEKITKLKILVENDANAAAFGEYYLGAGQGANNMFYATLGKGVGGALILDGKLWRGTSGYAGEFGYVAVNTDGGKLEDVASSANIIRRTKIRFHQDPTSSLGRLDEEEIHISDVVGEAKRGDDFAQLMLERTGMYVGTAIASVINLLNIERIVVGGEIMKAGNFVLDAIIQRAKQLSFVPSFKTTEIVQGKFGENAAAIGVALLIKRKS